MRALVIGSKGQLGSDLLDVWRDDAVGLGHDEIDLCDRDAAIAAVARHRPEIVINCAAYVRVDDCETEVERAFDVNAIGAKHMAGAAEAAGAAVMFISTDYVFDGGKGTPYAEDDGARPLSVYGMSKLAGEHLVRQSSRRHYIVRSSGLFGVAGASGKGGNFVETMLRKARAGEPLRVVDDQISSPTYTRDLAGKLQELAATNRYGLYHVTNHGQVSWNRFAAAIFEQCGLAPQLSPITSGELAAPAPRPAYSVLENGALPAAGLAPLRSWNEALADYLRVKGHLR